jgi:hypothetical protein
MKVFLRGFEVLANLVQSRCAHLTHQLPTSLPYSPDVHLFVTFDIKGSERSLRSEWLILNHCLKVVAGVFAGGISGVRE